jgi:hypothetical protein
MINFIENNIYYDECINNKPWNKCWACVPENYLDMAIYPLVLGL